MALGVVFRRSPKVPPKPTMSRKRIKYYIGRLSKAMEAKLDLDRKQNKRCSTSLIFGHVQYSQDGTTQIKRDMWTVRLPEDKRSWNEATADEIELAILLMISPMPETYMWHECRLYAQKFVNECTLVTTTDEGDGEGYSSSDEADPYLPSSLPLFTSPPEPRVDSITNTTNTTNTSNATNATNATVDLANEDSTDDIIYEGTYPKSFFRRKALEYHALYNDA